MTRLLTADFETGPDAGDIAVADTPFSAITLGGTSTVKYNAANAIFGSFAAKIDGPSSSIVTLDQTGLSFNKRYMRRYWKIPVAPGGTDIVTLTRLRDAANATVAELRLNAAGNIVIRNTGGVTVATSAQVYGTNAAFRVVWLIDGPNATQQCKIFSGANFNGTSPDETLNGAWTSTTVTTIKDGIGSGFVAGYTVYLDGAADDDAQDPGIFVASSGATALWTHNYVIGT